MKWLHGSGTTIKSPQAGLHRPRQPLCYPHGGRCNSSVFSSVPGTHSEGEGHFRRVIWSGDYLPLWQSRAVQKCEAVGKHICWTGVWPSWVTWLTMSSGNGNYVSYIELACGLRNTITFLGFWYSPTHSSPCSYKRGKVFINTTCTECLPSLPLLVNIALEWLHFHWTFETWMITTTQVWHIRTESSSSRTVQPKKWLKFQTCISSNSGASKPFFFFFCARESYI